MTEWIHQSVLLNEVLEAFPLGEERKLLIDGTLGNGGHSAALLRKYPNLHIELSNMQANRAVETLVEVDGAKQILFGTGLPKMSAGAARAFIDYAMISDEDKQNIAGGNLARLCGIPLPAPAESNIVEERF